MEEIDQSWWQLREQGMITKKEFDEFANKMRRNRYKGFGHGDLKIEQLFFKRDDNGELQVKVIDPVSRNRLEGKNDDLALKLMRLAYFD